MKLTWSKMRTDLLISGGSLKSLFESMMNDLMNDEFGGLNALKIMNFDKERRK